MTEALFRVNRQAERIVETGRHVPLRSNGMGVYVNPVDPVLCERVQGQLEVAQEKVLQAYAERNGYHLAALTADQRSKAINEAGEEHLDDVIELMVSMMIDTISGWDEGFAIDEETKEVLHPSDPVGNPAEGKTVLHLWSNWVCRRDQAAVYKIFGAAAEYTGELKGNSPAGPGGISSTGQLEETAENPSTADDNQSVEVPTVPEDSVDSEEVQAVPA